MSDLQKFEILREYETIILKNDLRIYESILCQVAEFLEDQSQQLAKQNQTFNSGSFTSCFDEPREAAILRTVEHAREQQIPQFEDSNDYHNLYNPESPPTDLRMNLMTQSHKNVQKIRNRNHIKNYQYLLQQNQQTTITNDPSLNNSLNNQILWTPNNYESAPRIYPRHTHIVSTPNTIVIKK